MLRLSTFIVCLLGASLTLGCRKSAEPEQKALCSAPCPKPGPSKEVLRFPDVWKDFCNGPRSIPFEIFGGRQFVRVTLRGPKATREIWFHVDTTGTSKGVQLARSVAEELGYASIADLPSGLSIAGHEIALPTGAEWELQDDVAFRRDYARRKGFSVGQLGAGFLSRFHVCIDPASKRLSLGDPAALEVDPKGGNGIRFVSQILGYNSALYPAVAAALVKRGEIAHQYGFLIDTGASSSMLDESVVAFHHGKHPDWPFASGAFGDADMLGGEIAEQVLVVPEVTLLAPGYNQPTSPPNAQKLKAVQFVSRPTGQWGMFGSVKGRGTIGAVGNDVLARYRLLIDYARSRLFLAPVPNAAGPLWERVGLSFEFKDGCPVIRRVAEANSPARKLVKVGDTLLSVDGKDACKLWHHELTQALAGKVGTLHDLELQRGGRKLQVQVPTVRLLSGE
ncbi:MAG: hypothetical protein H6718_21295 [Polyangiaceae bacterium]|nr:hypothetical protein [Myxococcales bacterium]MCB9587955.1 hypothetical protein [Polyangiaceae bacterium]